MFLLIPLLFPWGKANNPYPNNRYPLKRKPYVELPLGTVKAQGWLLEMPAHHCAVGVGYVASKIEQLGKLLGIDTVRIC